MRLPTRQSTMPGMNMTPMIDVVFQLIIFFLLASHLVRHDVQLELALPTAETGDRLAEDEVPRVTINVLQGGQINLGGETVDAAELTTKLGIERARLGADVEVRVRSDRTTAYRNVEPILLACSRAGVWNVTFAVTRKED